MTQLFTYTGPADLLELVSQEADIYTRHVTGAAGVRAWMNDTQQGADADHAITVTYILNGQGELWIGERRMEHVVVAHGQPVAVAGEMRFGLDDGVSVVHVTNQSTGYCPRPSGWAHLRDALNAAGLAHPGTLSRAFEFRRCGQCGTLNLIKDDDFYCAVCDQPLPLEWNVGNEMEG